MSANPGMIRPGCVPNVGALLLAFALVLAGCGRTTGLPASSRTGGRDAAGGGGGNRVVDARADTGGLSGAGGGSGGASLVTGSAGNGSGGASGPAGGNAGTSVGGLGGTRDGGIVAPDYCSGGNAKVTYAGQTITPGVTDYQTSLIFDCCMSYGVNLHTLASLGFDVQVEVVDYTELLRGDYQVGGSASGVRIAVKTSDQSTLDVWNNASGNLHVTNPPAYDKVGEIALCLEVVDVSSALVGMRIYAPKVVLVSSSSSRTRFQIYLLKDATIRTDSPATRTLDSLVLAEQALLDLGRIAYVERATTRIGLNPGHKLGDTMRAQLGTPLGLPFVVVVDGVRIYLGTFTARFSSIGPLGPWLYVEDIASDGFVIQPPLTGADPRNDARIEQALTETGKLVP